MKNVAAIILGGGQGGRLYPLTLSRCKPALCYGGRYRIIDIPISNAIHSGCNKIFIVTQFLSRSLHRHILSTYCFGPPSTCPIELLAAEEKPQNKTWYQGTADAVRQNINYLEETSADYFLILSGDQIYHMDFKKLLDRALETNADMVISCLPVKEMDAKRMGILQIDQNHLITSFFEKPQLKSDLDKFRLNLHQINRLHIDPTKNGQFLGSMGIYLFKRQVLIDLLTHDPREDFGKHLIPALIEKKRVAAHLHEGYWADIGTIESFYTANMALTQSSAPFNCYNENWPIFSSPMTLPGSKVLGALIKNSLLCEGTIIEESEISHSIIGPRSFIQSSTKILNSYLMGNDSATKNKNISEQIKPLHIGKNCVIANTIIDRHATIGHHVQLVNKKNILHYDGENVYIRDGIIIVPYGASIPDHFIL